MRRVRYVVVLVAFFVTISIHSASACSTFYIGSAERPVFGKNYDWSVDVGLLIVNKRGVAKTAMTGDNPARWVSKYGSVTFNQYGRELPSGGMNQAGLVVELMWLDDTEYPKADERHTVGNMQWIQYQLDNSATVDEVISSDSAIRIRRGGAGKIHYLVADRQGNVASIEFIDGELEFHSGEKLPWSVLTNHTYDSSVAYLNGFQGFGGDLPVARGSSSLDRFVNAADMVARFEDGRDRSSVDYGFDILRDVAQGDYTKWSIVYDIRDAVIYFRTFANANRRFVRMAEFNFDCDAPVMVLDVNTEGYGDVTSKFLPYTRAYNRALIEQAFDQTSFLKGVPMGERDRLSKYPAATNCTGQVPAGK